MAAVLSACTQSSDDGKTQSDADSQKIEVPGVSIESKGGEATVITSDENEIVITGNKLVQNRVCIGQNIQLQGDDNKADFTGRCEGLSLIGSRNAVTLENVAAIEVPALTIQCAGAVPSPKSPISARAIR